MRPTMVSDSLSRPRFARATFFGWFLPMSLAMSVACGPSLSEPADTNVSGDWRSTDIVPQLSEMSISIVQHEDGSITGQWSGKLSGPATSCPNLGPNPTGPVSGANTVLGVHFSLVGEGEFQGQLLNLDSMRGSFQSCGSDFLITFSRIATLAGG